MSDLENVLSDDYTDFIFNIARIVTVYHSDFTKNYVFDGEKHDFWELVYVDYGEIEVTADSKCYRLEKDDIIFHKPNEFHTLAGNKKIASSVLIISFVCHSDAMVFFENSILKASQEHRKILGKFVNEAKGVFKDDLGRLYRKDKRLEMPVFGAEHMMYLYLTQLLILLVRENSNMNNHSNRSGLLRKSFSDSVINSIITYLENNLDQPICLDDICKEFYLSKTYLKRFFKQETSYTVMNYLKELRMEKAKSLIREEEHSFSEIARMVGFDSLTYFSTVFKRNEGMSPSDYLESIKKFESSTSR